MDTQSPGTALGEVASKDCRIRPAGIGPELSVLYAVEGRCSPSHPKVQIAANKMDVGVTTIPFRPAADLTLSDEVDSMDTHSLRLGSRKAEFADICSFGALPDSDDTLDGDLVSICSEISITSVRRGTVNVRAMYDLDGGADRGQRRRGRDLVVDTSGGLSQL